MANHIIYYQLYGMPSRSQAKGPYLGIGRENYRPQYVPPKEEVNHVSVITKKSGKKRRVDFATLELSELTGFEMDWDDN